MKAASFIQVFYTAAGSIARKVAFRPSTFTSTSCRVQAMRLVELQCEADARQACAAIGREVADADLRGWAALLPENVLAEGMRHSGLPVLQGARGALVLGSIAQIRLAARSLANALERESLREAARELMRRAAKAGAPAPASGRPPPRRSPPADRTGGLAGVNAAPPPLSHRRSHRPVGPGLA